MTEPNIPTEPPPQPSPPRASPLIEVERQLTALENLATIELCARYLELFGKPPRTRHRTWLLRKIAYRIQEQRLGGLSMTARKRLNDLMAEIEFPEAPVRKPGRPRRTSIGRPATNSITYETPLRACSAPGSDLRPGTLITKVWRGTELRLVVQEHGFELDGLVHKSLSAAAKAATGAHWNGRLFWFGRTK